MNEIERLQSQLEDSEKSWSAYAVTLNRRLERVLTLARRRGLDEASIKAALVDPEETP